MIRFVATMLWRFLSHVLLIPVLFIAVGCSDDQPTEKPYKLVSKYGVTDPEFSRTIGNLMGPPLIGGNSTQTLLNGDQIFPPMLAAIRNAKKTVDFETYVYWSGQVGADFSHALSERAANGVKVHVILDTIGADRIDNKFVKEMTDAGVQLVYYHPLRWYDIGWANKLNNRTHRKLLVVDGEIGFTGGVGIADEWMGNADSPEHWRDNHYLVKGPIVSQLQAAFADNWMESTGKVLHGDEYFPHLDSAGTQWAQVFRSSPHGGSESMELMYLISLAAAQKNIRIECSYFVPDDLTIQTLIDAKNRGVSVQIITPGPLIDEKIVRRASRARWGEMLQAGVQIYEYQPTMFHCKLLIVDDAWVSIGSANIDNRSFRLNDEANLNILDAEFAAEQIRVFNDDMMQCHLISYEQWQKRPLWGRIMEAVASPFGWLM